MRFPRTPRREFLKTAAGSALLSLAPAGPAVAANDRISVAFVGVGTMGTDNLRAAMAQQGVAISAICDVYQPHLERAVALARRNNHQPQEIADFREVLANPSIDAVCVSTPDHWHPYITVEACKAGKDVYVEKPACVSIDDGWPMVDAARKHARVVQAGTWQRSGQHFQKACELVRNGSIGKVTMCKTWIYSNQPQAGIGNPANSPVPPGLNWDLWQGPAPARPFNPNRFGVYPNAYSYFRFFWDYAGGQLTDSGVHMLDIVQMAFQERMPLAATALGGKFWFQDDTETPDTLQVTYEYPGFLATWEHRSNNTEATKSRLMGVSFHGTLGTVYVDRTLCRLTPEAGSGIPPFEMARVSDPHLLHWANFIDCVRTRKRPNSDIETCVRSSATSILGNVSYRSKLRTDWDEARRTVAQPEARRLLAPHSRPEWALKPS
ncbi:MAG: gfo/Idh/MocA family oxidoreductase [Bryobacterales bacterium]|nr:gfo/Idh/MocA family oxidoreductase [Bryobacterales bacterium]